MAPASPRHGAVQGEAAWLIGNRLADLPGPPCRVIVGPGSQPKVRADWPDNPIALTLGDDVALESIDFTAPIAAFYRTV
jgi:hypothetical protein